MKKIYLYASLFVTAMTFTACNEDFKDWAAPQAWEQEATQEAINGTIEAAAQDVKIADITEEGIALVNFVGADNATADSKVVYTSLLLNDEVSVPFTTDGNKLVVNKADLAAALKTSFKSLASVNRECKFKVEASLVNADGVAMVMPIKTNEVTINVTPEALPAISNEEEFFYIGGYNSWNLASPTPMTKNDDGTYSCTIELSAGDEWFAFAPKSAVDNQDWNGLFRATKNGDENTSGFFSLDSSCGFSFCLKAEAGKYKFTISPKDWTYKYEKVVDMLYYAGDANGWSFSPLAKTGNDFVGYYYVKYADNSNTWGFKFTQDASWDKPQYGAGATSGSIAIDGGNIQLAEKDAFYQIVVNTGDLTCALHEISQMSLIGSAVNGDSTWGTDYDLTFNTETMAWEGTYTMTDGEFKIRANHDWTLSWGGALDAMTSQNGGNITITAGTYKFSFKPNCDGQGTLTVTVQ